jgi:hypothetical protein
VFPSYQRTPRRNEFRAMSVTRSPRSAAGGLRELRPRCGPFCMVPEGRPLNAYEVLRPFGVDVGPLGRWFGQPGGGLQYDLGSSVQQLVYAGFLRAMQ